MFTDSDDEKARYAVLVNETMARRFWPKKEAIGRGFTIASDPKHPVQIVGVVKDSRYDSLTGPAESYFYLPFAQHYAGS